MEKIIDIAEELGLKRQTMYPRMKKLGIEKQYEVINSHCALVCSEEDGKRLREYDVKPGRKRKDGN